jgi:hypothetical protein
MTLMQDTNDVNGCGDGRTAPLPLNYRDSFQRAYIDTFKL